MLQRSTTLEVMREPVQSLAYRIEATLSTDIEKLCDANRERAFTSTSNLLAKIYHILAAATSQVEGDMLVCQGRYVWNQNGISETWFLERNSWAMDLMS